MKEFAAEAMFAAGFTEEFTAALSEGFTARGSQKGTQQG